ncbi:MAG: hypothetical protein KJ650_10170 [Firmicutes bacterium]|nr:hypothetical protein [Bacillota bacterium]MBV1726930.1 hypothetical protein [Desulforudis sp.]MBU4533973.1 hypothetical protein [Bacillota bacterium]MBU4554242.1 hypothetical protein [Bacillota bacterium]MBV1734791.1 hypothetical protein [Desulforudis sp.]
MLRYKARMVERWHKITFGEKHVLQIENVQALVLQVVHVVRQEVPDMDTVDRISKRLQSLQLKG